MSVGSKRFRCHSNTISEENFVGILKFCSSLELLVAANRVWYLKGIVYNI